MPVWHWVRHTPQTSPSPVPMLGVRIVPDSHRRSQRNHGGWTAQPDDPRSKALTPSTRSDTNVCEMVEPHPKPPAACPSASQP